MRHVRRLLTAVVFLGLAFSAAGSSPKEQVLDNYQNGLSPGWETKSFVGQTHYTAENNDKQFYIKATSTAAASGLFHKIDYDPKEQPILRWSWKIERTLARGDERTKAGDDYAARIYVVFPSLLFWNTRALNYVWANRLPRGEALPNAFTANAMMIAVESGNGRAGQWLNEERNIYEDFKKYFKREPPRVGAIAIMTDTDNTGESATAWYGPIIIGRK
ncbi:MAG: hypothetical protein A2505_09275 [Deltaproteobacteria bacterium RIFOXYD12_FULL_55_16]|nr:MAG: hypothetical protein A2505_09275 [Deltaproteobacteria bacterium RIFOXYD12_FULL_55_16]